MTETNEMKNPGINKVVVATDGGQPVLLIALKDAYQDHPQYQRYMKREYEGTKELQHENLLKVLGLKEVEGYGVCIETEWHEARTLAEYLHESHTEDEKKRIIRNVATALAYMHENGHVHGAVNTHNIFITTKGDEVKLLSVRLRYADNLKRPADELKFIAPEAKDGTLTIDARADVFSLGILIKEMGLSAEYQQVIDICSRFGRNERYASIEEFLDAFEHHRYSRAADTTGNASGSNKHMAIIVALIVVLVIAAAALLFSQGRDNDNTTTTPAAEVVDTTESQATQPANDPAQPAADAANAGLQQPANPAEATTAEYTGENAYLNELVPQMQIDLDKIYNSGDEAVVIRRKVRTYYRGLRATLKDKTQEQLAAFDKAFADYNNSKK